MSTSGTWAIDGDQVSASIAYERSCVRHRHGHGTHAREDIQSSPVPMHITCLPPSRPVLLQARRRRRRLHIHVNVHQLLPLPLLHVVEAATRMIRIPSVPVNSESSAFSSGTAVGRDTGVDVEGGVGLGWPVAGAGGEVASEIGVDGVVEGKEVDGCRLRGGSVTPNSN
ncbi:hypothetical protein R3P38DRAFT_2807160 [Favolaschia claudopus]|uniref:Uncharacterized protein n=1 Tax=Favolaschia claudopus TaxID=2862362 RepID=A0AAV9ZIA8_9AGAR